MKQPNVIIFVLDSLRVDFVSVYGFGGQTTPHLDDFASQSTVYELAYTTAPWTLPAHASLFTGLYPRECGMLYLSMNNTDQPAFPSLNPDCQTMASILSKGGYNTACFTANPMMGKHTGLDKGFETYQEVFRRGNSTLGSLTRRGVNKFLRDFIGWGGDYGAKRVVKQMKHWISRSSKPFFVFSNILDIHHPYLAPRPFRRKTLSKKTSKNVFKKAMKLSHNPEKLNSTEETVPKKVSEVLAELYLAEVAYVDSVLGTFIHWLQERGLFDNSLIIITSDHGEELGERNFIGHKHHLTEALVRIPLLIHYPGQGDAQRSSNLVSLIDILPTVLEICKLPNSKPPYTLSGTSLVDGNRTYLFAEESKHRHADKTFGEQKIMVRDRTRKIIRNLTRSEDRYFKYQENSLQPGMCPSEDGFKDLLEALDEWQNSTRPSFRAKEAKEMDEQIRKRLSDLGYLS